MSPSPDARETAGRPLRIQRPRPAGRAGTARSVDFRVRDRRHVRPDRVARPLPVSPRHTPKGSILRIVFAGTPEAAVPSLTAALGSRHEVVAVVTRPDARSGRGRAFTASPVANVAAAAGIELLKPPSAADPDFVAALRRMSPDAAVVVAYGALLRPAVLGIPRHGWVNLHFSLLPAWRGAAPVQAAIRAGDEITGATTFRLDPGMDTGPVYGVLTEPIRPRDTAGELLERLATAGAALLVATLDGIGDGSLSPRPQPADGVSHAPKITAADARIDWATPALAVDRHVRAMTPDPGAWTDSPWGRLRVGPVEPFRDDTVPPLAPGELRAERRRVAVGTGTGPVALREVTPPGRRPMPALDWARGARPGAGAVLGAASGAIA